MDDATLFATWVDTKDGAIPLMCLGVVETKEKIDSEIFIVTKYIYQGEVVRTDYKSIDDK